MRLEFRCPSPEFDLQERRFHPPEKWMRPRPESPNCLRWQSASAYMRRGSGFETCLLRALSQPGRNLGPGDRRVRFRRRTGEHHLRNEGAPGTACRKCCYVFPMPDMGASMGTQRCPPQDMSLNSNISVLKKGESSLRTVRTRKRIFNRLIPMPPHR